MLRFFYLRKEENIMNDLGTKTIETERLILRKFDISDAPGMFYGWASDKNVTKYVSWNTHVDIAETLAVIENWVKRYDANSYIGIKVMLPKS